MLVLEDVHWADDATLDCDHGARAADRLASGAARPHLPSRRGAAGSPAPRRGRGGRAPRTRCSSSSSRSPENAVASLVGDRANEVYAATGGNPFYVTELLGSRAVRRAAASRSPSPCSAEPPGSTTTRGASSSWSRSCRAGSRTPMLDAVMPDWAEAAAEPERRQLLEVEPRHVRFRHELARHAIRSSIPIAGRRRLHAEILEVLLATDADPADIVHHAEAAGAVDVVAEYALVAARRAAAARVESGGVLPLPARRGLRRPASAPRSRRRCSRSSPTAAYLVGRLADAFSAIERAIAIYGELGDDAAVGRCERILSRLHWVAGDGAAARTAAFEAIAILEPLGPSSELARAYSTVSQLEMLADDPDATLPGARARSTSRPELGDEQTRAHALVNIGTARLNTDGTTDDAPRGTRSRRGRRRPARGGAGARQPRLQPLRLGAAGRSRSDTRSRQPPTAPGTSCSSSRPTPPSSSHGSGCARATGTRPSGCTRREIESGMVVRLIAKTVLAELAVRRGDPDAAERLAEIGAEADRTGEPQRIVPVLELADRVGVDHRRPDADRAARAADRTDSAARQPRVRYAMRVAAWAAVAGIEVEVDTPMSRPHAAMARRDWRAAADAFGEVGWSYDRALMLSLLDDEESLVEAIEIARELGAEPLTRRVAAGCASSDCASLAARERRSRANPAGLTARQLEVLIAPRRRPDERRDRRATRRLTANGRAPCRRGDAEARRHDAPRRRPACVRARPLGPSLSSSRAAMLRQLPGELGHGSLRLVSAPSDAGCLPIAPFGAQAARRSRRSLAHSSASRARVSNWMKRIHMVMESLDRPRVRWIPDRGSISAGVSRDVRTNRTGWSPGRRRRAAPSRS